jgi:transcriptional regulator with GAF, ATPase, and Fis domain
MVAATNRDLEASVRAGTFRADLFFRLSGGTIRLPPLRERPRDIVALARMFLERHCAAQKRAPMGISTGAERALARHAWPGNVRELMYAIERAAALAAKGGVIEVEHLARESAGAMPAAAVVATEEDATGDPERARIEAALAKHAGNQTQAARELGITRRMLITLLDRYALPRPRRR